MQCLNLDRPLVMGILNITPDSFSDGGSFFILDSAIAQAKQMAAEGADIIDIGGESARPGARAIGVEEELERVIPVIHAVCQETNIPISIDTCKPEVMQAAVQAGAAMINDIYALRRPGALAAAVACDVPVCLMHMQGEPEHMQIAPQYQNVLEDIKTFFNERIETCLSAGIKAQHIILDPGFGFGKTLQHNMQLTKHLAELQVHGFPLLFGASRKASIGAILNKPESERLFGSIAAAILAVANGAKIVRVHDVGATKDALMVADQIESAD